MNYEERHVKLLLERWKEIIDACCLALQSLYQILVWSCVFACVLLLISCDCYN